MIDPRDADSMKRFYEAKHRSYEKLEPFRKRNLKAIEQYVGGGSYSDEAGGDVLLNLMELGIDIYERQLVARPPLVNVFTRSGKHKPTGVKLKSLMNDRLRTYEVHDVLKDVVKQALFSIGLLKIGREPSGETEIAGKTIFRHKPFVRSILLDDWVHDMSARTWREIGFMGHRYQIELEEAMAREDFDEEAKKHLRVSDRLEHNDSGDERTSSLTGSRGEEDFIKRPVDVWEIFLPQEQLLVTCTDTQDVNVPPLKVAKWTGPPHGPFHMLFFKSVPGNAMPLSIGSLWIGMHKLVNCLYDKMADQAERQKQVGLVQGSDQEDAQKIMDASDGHVVGIMNPNAIQEARYGGIDQNTFAFTIDALNRFNWFAGNLDLLGGLGAQSDTATQDKMLNENASQRIAGMQDTVTLFTRKVLTDFGFYLWEDPVESYPVEIEIPGLEFPLPDVLGPEERKHDYYEHEVDIEPYSMVFQSPGQRLAMLNQFMTQFVMPALPLIQQSGQTVDWQYLLRLYSEYGNMPEIVPLFKLGAPIVVQGSGGQETRAPSVSHRENVRTNKSGATRQGSDQVMVNSLMGGNPQASQMAQVGRAG